MDREIEEDTMSHRSTRVPIVAAVFNVATHLQEGGSRKMFTAAGNLDQAMKRGCDKLVVEGDDHSTAAM